MAREIQNWFVEQGFQRLGVCCTLHRSPWLYLVDIGLSRIIQPPLVNLSVWILYGDDINPKSRTGLRKVPMVLESSPMWFLPPEVHKPFHFILNNLALDKGPELDAQIRFVRSVLDEYYPPLFDREP